MSSIHAGTMLAYLAGSAVLVCAVLAVYWGVQRVPRGFGLWTASCGLIGIGCVVLAEQVHFPRPVTLLLVPGLVVLAAVLRLEGLRQFLGRRRVDRRLLLLPVAAVALLAVFVYARDDAAARAMVITTCVALILWTMAAVSLKAAGRSYSLFLRCIAGLFVAYGALWLGSGIHWLIKQRGFPLNEVDTQGIVFFAALTAFELLWLIGCLVLSAKWNAEAVENARGVAESARRQLADIVDCLPDATFALDKECKVVAWNRVIEEKTGVPATQVVGIRLDEGGARALLGGEATLSEVLLNPSKPLPSTCHDVRRGVNSISAEEEFRHPVSPDKSGHFWHLAALLRDDGGEVGGTIESIRDITWRVEAERAMRESEERYRSLFEHSLDGILVIAPGGTVVDANPSACRMLMMSREALCEASPGSLIDRGGRIGIDDREDSVLGTAVRELSFVRGDGSMFPAECMSVVWNDSTGHVRAFVQFRDISERVEAQRILRESQGRLLEAQAASYIGIWEMDLVGRSIWLSPEALRIFGLSGHTSYFPLETATLTDLAESPADLLTALARVMTEGGSYDVEYLIKRDDDGALRKVHSIGAAICGDDGVPVKVVGATQDVTESQATPSLPDSERCSIGHSDNHVSWVDPEGKVTNVAGGWRDRVAGADGISREDTATFQDQKLEAVGQLAGGIAHDFNNLLTAIIGYGNLILADEDAQGLKSLRRDAEEIRNAAERAAALTSQILAFARRQPLRPRKICLGDLVSGMEERLRSLLTDDVQLATSCSPEAGVVEVDTEQFEQVLVNLVKNAREAMPLGGRAFVGVENVEVSEEYCRTYPELRAGSYAVLSVSDTGTGMDADTRLRIFEPFFSTKPPGEGVGLGLSAVYGIVRQSGGNVLVYSEVDKGTTLKIYLPRLAESVDGTPPGPAVAHAPGGGGETVLVVEDEAPVRRLVARVLGGAGYRVFVAGSGPEALELLEDMEEAPDLLITDVVLPGGLQGNELAGEFVSRVPDLPVLYMSGHPRDAIVHAGRLDEGVCFLGKPFTPQGLSSKVREVLDSHPR
jgi:PAS domain S-box-containing protein